MKSCLFGLMLCSLICIFACNAVANAFVYDFSLSVKTTKAERGKVKPYANMCGESGELLYRKQATVKIQGLVWGCGCDELITPPAFTGWYNDGFVFWNTTEKIVYSSESEFAWRFINRIASTAKETEGCWDIRLQNAQGETAFDLVGAGFGTMYDKIIEKDKESGIVLIDYESSYVKSMTGSFAGISIGPKKVTVTVIQEEECSYCEGGKRREELVETEESLVWDLCACGSAEGGLTAAHGTWTMKYNASAAKKLAGANTILKATTIPKYVQNGIY